MSDFRGDYPGLDSRRMRFYRWLRQGSAALAVVMAIVFAVEGKVEAASEWRWPQYPLHRYGETKLDNMFPAPWENVAVACPSPQELVALSVTDREHVLGSNPNCCAPDFRTGAEDEWLGISLLVGCAKHKLVDCRNPCCSGQSGHGMCWGGARIFPDDSYVQANHAPFIVHLQFGNRPQNENLSALNGPAVSDLPASDEGQNQRGNKQEASKASNWIVAGFLQITQYPWLITAAVGGLCGAIGLTLYVNRSGLIAGLGFVLLAAGLLCPIFPWWVFVVLPFVGGDK